MRRRRLLEGREMTVETKTKKKAMNITAGMHQQDLPLLTLISSTKMLNVKSNFTPK